MRVAIVGAGPAGAALAYLFARRGIEVVLIERQSDFAREFRGEGLMPGGVDALRQMGLGAELDALPQARMSRLEVFLNGRRELVLELSRPAARTRPCRASSPSRRCSRCWSRRPRSSPASSSCAASPYAIWCTTASASRACASKARRACASSPSTSWSAATAAPPRCASAPRSSAPREAQSFDVVWCKLPLPEFMRATARGCIGRGHFAICFESPDGGLQLGWAIAKGTFGDIRRGGIEHWIGELAANVPDDLAAWIRAHATSVSSPFLLDVVCDHLDVWSAPGLLLLGDAAHPMSPVGAQGINIALRDALVAANHLGPALARNARASDLDAASLAVVAERLPEVKAIQALQAGPPRMMLQQTPLARFVMRVVVPFAMRTGISRLLFVRVFPRFALGTTKVTLGF